MFLNAVLPYSFSILALSIFHVLATVFVTIALIKNICVFTERCQEGKSGEKWFYPPPDDAVDDDVVDDDRECDDSDEKEVKKLRR